MSNILIDYGEGGLGDSLSLLAFAKDFKEQRPNDSLFITFNSLGFKASMPYFRQRELIILKSNGTLKKYSNERIDKTINFKFPLKNDICWESPSEDDVITNILQRPYIIFKRNGIDIRQTYFYIPFDLTSEEKQFGEKFLKDNKPLALINCGYHKLVSCKNWGIANYQKLVTSLSNKLTFIQIGENVLNGFVQQPLDDVTYNLINKTSLITLASLMYRADFVFGNITGTNLLASIPSYQKRHIFTMCGNREPKTYASYSGNHIDLHVMVGKSSFDNCYIKNRLGCWCQSIGECKRIIQTDQEQIAKCLMEVTVEDVVEEVLNILLNEKKNELFNH